MSQLDADIDELCIVIKKCLAENLCFSARHKFKVITPFDKYDI